MKLLIVCAILGVALAAVEDKGQKKESYGNERTYGKEEEGYGGADKQYGYEKEHNYETKKASPPKPYHPNSYDDKADYGQRHTYHGIYEGKCDNDGFYYKNYNSFIICSNNNAYEQACAPGSRNSAHDAYNYGGNYHYRDFCDINLVDYGYGTKGYHGYDDARPYYEGPYYQGGYKSGYYGGYDKKPYYERPYYFGGKPHY